MLTLLSVYRDTCHTGRPLKLSTQVLVLELRLLALISVYILHSLLWELLCCAMCSTMSTVQSTMCSNQCICTVLCAATSVLSLYSVQQLVFVLCAATCALCTVQCAVSTVQCTVCSNLALPCGGFCHCLLDRVSHTLVLWSPLHTLSVLAF